MWALIAFIGLGILVATLIEINERIKAKKAKEGIPPPEDCAQTETGDEACSACQIASACTKQKKEPR